MPTGLTYPPNFALSPQTEQAAHLVKKQWARSGVIYTQVWKKVILTEAGEAAYTLSMGYFRLYHVV